METERTERRYNTRFRGVPRSVFTISRTNKKSTKQNNENLLRTEIRNDFVYTKLGKKSNHSFEGEAESPPKVKIKNEVIPPVYKPEKKSSPSPPLPTFPFPKSSTPIQNGTHPPPTEEKVKFSPSVKVETLTSNNIETLPPVKVKKSLPEKIETLSSNEIQSSGPDEIQTSPPDKIQTSPPDEIQPSLPNCNNNDGSHESSPELSPEKDMEGIFFETKPDSEEINSTAFSGTKSVWIPSKETLSWNNSYVASYNPKTKMFRCVVCQAVGFMSRIGEHYLGTHCNAKVFHCPQCSYCSAWWRCVRNHMSKNHGVSNAPASMWKNQPLLDEIMQILQNLKASVDCEDRVERVAENSGKRYICPKCPYATDRRDLYNRHENIHREEKPFQCYICYKLFNRADHVKKHFCRIHKEFNYDINLIRRLPSKRSRIPVSPLNNGGSGPRLDINASFHDMMHKPPAVPMPPSQSHLLNCLTGSPTMVKVDREIDNMRIPENELKEEKNDNTFNKSHSNLLTFLTQNAFTTKNPKPPQPRNTDMPIKEILQEALMKPPGYSFLSSQPKRFMCPYCPWTGPNSWALRLHTSMHYKTFCVLCNFKSTEASDLENHMWDSHRKRSCSKCNFLADSLLALDAHMIEAHGQKAQFNCRHCSQAFEVRSDMEAHCIFIHNQVLQECKENGCDFCSTDPKVLETHKKEIHNSSSTSQDTSASRTLCLYCGCGFADPKSLTLHEELFHENPLQAASRRPLNPYCCAVCGYSTPKQPMMMEHMRIHTGQLLRCQAGDGCNFDTPYDTVLREHVLQSHSNDDGIVRCPHCGFQCSTRFSFVTHYKDLHHPFCCQICEDVEHKHFVLPFTLDTSIKSMFPFAKKVDSVSNNDGGEKTNDDGGRRSRKQMQPRKVVQDSSLEEVEIGACSPKKKAKITSSRNRKRENFISLYAEKVKKIAQASLYKCRFCVKSPIFFRNRRNYLFHRQWHYLRKYQCNKCIQTFRHRYQVLLHQRFHVDKENKVSS